MGSFYDNIHLRTQNRPLVEESWQRFWKGREEQCWAWVSPVYHGWVSVYDWRCDQQDAGVLCDLAAYLSREVDCTALAFQVQDSDLAEYWLFNHGARVDHYTSDAEYFAAYAERPETTPGEGVYSGYGPDSKAGYATEEDLTDGGNAELLKSLTDASIDEIEIEAILRTPTVIADDILTALASAIGINDIWASLGYYYLATEGDTIQAFEQFHHLPTDHPPNLERVPEH